MSGSRAARCCPCPRPCGQTGFGRSIGKCFFPSSSRCCHMHGSHVSADILCKLQDLHSHILCTENPCPRPCGQTGFGRRMGKCFSPSSSRCCHMHGSHISADILCKLQDLHGHILCTVFPARLRKKHLEGNLASTIPPMRQRLMTPRCHCKVRSSR